MRRFGLSKLIPAGEVQQFATKYVDATALAKAWGETRHRLSCWLRQTGVPTLEIVLPGKGAKIFLRKEVVKEMRLNSPQEIKPKQQK